MDGAPTEAVANPVANLTGGRNPQNCCQIRRPLKLIQVPSFTGAKMSTWTLSLGCLELLPLTVSRSNSKGVPTALAIAIRLFLDRKMEGKFGRDTQSLAGCTNGVEDPRAGCQFSTSNSCPPTIQCPRPRALSLSALLENVIRNSFSAHYINAVAPAKMEKGSIKHEASKLTPRSLPTIHSCHWSSRPARSSSGSRIPLGHQLHEAQLERSFSDQGGNLQVSP